MRPVFIWMVILTSSICMYGHRKPTQNRGDIYVPLDMHGVVHFFGSWYCWTNFSQRYCECWWLFPCPQRTVSPVPPRLGCQFKRKYFFTRTGLCWIFSVSIFTVEFSLIDFLFVISHFSITSRPALGPTQSPIQWVTGALSLGVKQLGHEADHSLPPSVKVKQCIELYLHSPVCFHGIPPC